MSKTKIKFNEKALKNTIMEAARKKATEMSFDIECPHCHANVNVTAGISTCPACGNQIDLQVNVNF